MKGIKVALLVQVAAAASIAHARLESKVWPASDKAEQFVKGTSCCMN